MTVAGIPGSGEFVFPGNATRCPLSGMRDGNAAAADEGRERHVHGFRSSFRDWAGERTSFPREVAEAALAHVVGDETERAYRRGDALQKRRKLMEAWAEFLAAPRADCVVLPMHRGAGGQ